ncbi:MAG: PAS domain-containing protein [Sulfuritalea sp.]|nr:PAS domain-containing protein [Sulfuritalea sp.]
MNAQGVEERQSAGSQQDVYFAAANLANRSDYCTLILDSLGRILSCGAPAEKIFGLSQNRLIGRPLSDFIGGLFLKASSPSYSARYLGYLCNDRDWRKFAATDAAGQAFHVELNLARMAHNGPEREMYLLNLRRAG